MNVDQHGIWPFLLFNKITETIIEIIVPWLQGLHLEPFIYINSFKIFDKIFKDPLVHMKRVDFFRDSLFFDIYLTLCFYIT